MQSDKSLTHSPLAAVTKDAPVVVIGGGIAGLTAAWELYKRGIPVKVLESTPHLGGRIHTVQSHQGHVETGMQFYYSAYSQTKRLLREFNLAKDLIPIHVQGLIYWQGKSASFSKTRPWLSLLTVGENLRLQGAVARQVFALLKLSPFDYHATEALDQIDTASYFLEHGNEAILEVAVRPLVNSYAFCEPEGHSLAMLLRIIKLGALASTYGLLQGNDSLPQAIAKKVDICHGKATEIVLRAGQVQAVVYEAEGIEQRIATSCVICAVRAPQAAPLLTGAPALSQAMAALRYSSIILANLSLDRALQGKDWVYVMSRKAGHQAAFAIDLMRRSPKMFPGGKSVIQVDFASPTSDALLTKTDDEIAAQAIEDMKAFFPEIGSWVTETSVTRRPQALPNFPCGMFAQVRDIQKQAAALRGLYLVGDYLRSPLCEGAVRSATQCLQSLVTY